MAKAKKSSNNSKKKIDKICVRMYRMGTGDCFIVKFYAGTSSVFTMMVDCGSCRGGKKEFDPYIKNLSEFVKKKIDLLVVTHEHQDHVNGFKKCQEKFKDFAIEQAWFAWTENPADPDGKAKELLKKRRKMRNGFMAAMSELESKRSEIENQYTTDANYRAVKDTNDAFLAGLHTLAEINLPAKGESKASLPGMVSIKEKVKGSKVGYLVPGQTKTFPKLSGLKFHILGPPSDRVAIFKDGKEGRDVYEKYLALNISLLSATAFETLDLPDKLVDAPFDSQHLLSENWIAMQGEDEYNAYKKGCKDLINQYRDKANAWRSIEHDWLAAVGSLALRLNSHINNTSLAFAIEIGDGGPVMLFPGDAEFGNWESWFSIKKWKEKGNGKRHFVEDLLSRVIFYKVSHHLSYNGTPTAKGIDLMPSGGMVAMATLDRDRIAENWKSTMPNKLLLQDLIQRCDGKFFIMNEKGIRNPPSKSLDFSTLDEDEYDGSNPLYMQYTFSL